MKMDSFFDNLSEKIPTDGEITADIPIFNPIVVNNQEPTIPPSTYRLAIIGEAPGVDEELQGKPFVGQSGKFLDNILSLHGITRACCLIANVMLIRPPKKKGQQLSPIDKWDKSDIGNVESHRLPLLTAGLEQLALDIATFNPNLCFLLGKTALWAARQEKSSIDDWRGSVFIADKPGPLHGRKCLASFHPARCLREYSDTTMLHFWDTPKAKREAMSPELVLPKRNIRINLPFDQLCYELNEIILQKPLISCDIEGGCDSLSCIGIAVNAGSAFVIPFLRLDGSPYWSMEEETHLWKLVGILMADGEIGKIWQNGLYDRFILQWSYSILVRGNHHDTMLKHWENLCELEKSLGFQCSIYTDEPYYKEERKTESQDEFYIYCGKDACVTYEINEKLEKTLTPEQKEHYKFNNEALNFLLYAELRGIRYDQQTANDRLQKVQSAIDALQSKLDTYAGSLGAIATIDWSLPNEEILKQVQAECCYKKDASKPKAAYAEGYPEVAGILTMAEKPSSDNCRKITEFLGLTMNMQSHKKFQDFLYKTCGLPVQYKKDLKTKEMRPTADYEAQLKLSKNHSHPVLPICLDLSLLTKRAGMLSVGTQSARINCSYNLVGSETGRVTSYTSSIPTRNGGYVGTNLQTIPDNWDVFPKEHLCHQGMRDLFLADEGCYLIKCDLKGSDGWTIGAYMKWLGDPTMLDDLEYGIKPAMIPAYILCKGMDAYLKVAKDRKALKAETSSCVKKEMWEYFVSKIGIWGQAYLMGPILLANKIFTESEGKVNLSQSQIKDFRAATFARYNFKPWHNWMKRYLDSQSYPAKLTASNGFTRKFFGRKTEILGDALAHLPQVYTTYATLKAATRLWNDPENRLGELNSASATNSATECLSTTTIHESTNGRYSGCRLRVEPLHQVHDEILMQCKISDTPWAISKITTWFDNPIEIAGQRIVIPFDGAYGTAWSMDEKHKVGEIK